MRAAIAILLATTILFAACTTTQAPQTPEQETITLGLPPWPGVTVKSEVAAQILESNGYTIEQQQLDAGIVYAQLREGTIDLLLAGWLPTTHQDYWDEHGENLERIQVNLNTTWLGLAVPTYTYEDGITTIEDLTTTDRFEAEIVGIEPGAGITQSTEQAIQEYELDYNLITSSTPSMMSEVDTAINEQEDIVFTIWEPHSAFARFDIKKLDDPQEIYGGGDVVYTIARDGFTQEHPQLRAFFEAFTIPADVQSEWIPEYSDNDRPPEAVAREWISENNELVAAWNETLT